MDLSYLDIYELGSCLETLRDKELWQSESIPISLQRCESKRHDQSQDNLAMIHKIWVAVILESLDTLISFCNNQSFWWIVWLLLINYSNLSRKSIYEMKFFELDLSMLESFLLVFDKSSKSSIKDFFTSG